MKNENRPGFFIVGAPKCGTTAMAKYLSDHPDIYMPKKKEIHFFANDLPGYIECKTEGEYLNKFFGGVVQNHSAVGEASVYYLYSEVAIQNIQKFNPNAKIIVMLRNPVEMLYSLHSQLIYSANEDELDFNTAWHLSEKRKQGKMLPKYSTDEKILYYHEIAMYGQQLQRLYKYFPKEQVKIIFFEDFKRDTKKIYEDLLGFLNVKSDNRIMFERINENTLPLSVKMNQLLIDQPKLIKWSKELFKIAFGIKDLKITRAIKKANTKKVDRQPLHEEIKLEIMEKYKDDIKLLSKLTDTDLSVWLSVNN